VVKKNNDHTYSQRPRIPLDKPKKEKEGNQPVNNTAGTDMKSRAGCCPNPKAGRQVHDNKNLEGYLSKKEKKPYPKDRKRKRIGEQVLNIAVDKRGRNNPQRAF
jgi:hypothetical protein